MNTDGRRSYGPSLGSFLADVVFHEFLSHSVGKRQRAGALQDASARARVLEVALATWSAVVLYRFRIILAQ